MLNSLLNAVGVDSLILDIFIILGVVVAGSLIFYFLWEAVSNMVNKNKKEDAGVPNFDEPKKTKENTKQNTMVADFTLDAQPEDVVVIEENKLSDIDETKAEAEKAEAEKVLAEEEREAAERRAYLEARRQELIKRMQAEIAEEEEESEPVEEVAEHSQESETQEQAIAVAEEIEEPAEVVEQEITETAEQEDVAETEEKESEVFEAVEENETVEEEQEDETEEVAEVQADALETERKALEEEKARYALLVKELEEARKALMEQQANVSAPVVEVQEVVPVEYTLDELKEKLALAEERLRATEKEFKQCKKEYIPLHKVWAAFEKDNKKLRRKEALVAKQKVLLYGVNNYADIDEEKAKKLAEDLDLLDGLKLSVQHCEEVMKKNEDRYPLLQKMYNVLKLRNEELKKDIATYKEEIAKIEAEQSEDAE